MNDSGFDAFYLALMLILPISALAARRLPVGQTVKLALSWAAIFAVLFLLVSLWQDSFGGGASFGNAIS